MLQELVYRESCSEPCCSIFHAFPQGKSLGSFHNPRRRHPDVFSPTSIRIGAEVVAGDKNLLAVTQVSHTALLHNSGGIDARNMGVSLRHTFVANC
jgi:hypothetical protein